ncbi:putative transcription factor AP2-EREBP family [Helianthus annuus]|uniref:Putative integrase-type DNA-binding superfamily protein n=1 Tax=Helianthus annuus TaxID=4232 RepID=A0A251VJD8_HELAN|nr:AP2-like ethylene-responsive transcription factor PLT2 isoform X2 [Helianthus annuus]KAF5819891.1 putative transcription factor AP2-EREBP family [Helianthus annuus]KAJ0806551.1 putative transcription factor AP2-EREBP family [Helianthus annuus]KAJ0941395.1 putative transcription factor AP2-EREBP family [Helianthus annuus]KAJ0953101.1 putative transcription factor AP2-EREBP family [Helianthus annuus]
MNSNNWLSFPLSPTHSSLPPHNFSLGLVHENIDTPFSNQEWNLIGAQGSNDQVPKVADFLGVSKSENSSELVTYNDMQTGNDTDYLFTNSSLLPQVQNTLSATPTSYELPENSSTLQSLTLSMGSGKRSTCETSTGTDNTSNDNTNTTTSVVEANPRRTLDTFGQRTSIYRGVTRHRWTGRYEAHLWDNSCRREGQSRKGRQVYLGGYDKEEKAARAYDMAALKYWGTSTTTNFPITNYEKEIEDMKHMTRQEFVASIRRKSSGFSRGASMYRGVTRHHQHGRWQARIGRVAGNKDLYLGTFSTEEEAAEAYDIAAIKFRGLSAVTNFDMNRYDVKSILESNTLPIGGGAAKRLKEAQAIESSRKREEMIALGSGFPFGTSANAGGVLQAYPLLQQPFETQAPQPLLTLHNPEISHYSTQDPQFHQSYLQSHHHHPYNMHGSHQSSSQTPQFYNSYLQNNPVLLHGLMNMGGSSSSLMDGTNNNGGSSSGSYSGGGYLGNFLGQSGNTAEELAMVKVDYDNLPTENNYAGWSGDSSVQESNPSVFTMWND